MGDPTIISAYSSWYPAVSDRHMVSISAEEYTTTDLLSEQRQKLQKKELTERLSDFFGHLAGHWGKTSPDNAVTFNIKQFLQKSRWMMVTGV